MSVKNHKVPISREKDFLAFLQSLMASVGVCMHGGYFACLGEFTQEKARRLCPLRLLSPSLTEAHPPLFSYFTLFLFFVLFF